MNKIIILGCGYIGTNLANYIKAYNENEEVYVLGIENEYNEYLNSNVNFIPLRVEQICEDNKELFENSIVIDAVGNTNATNSSINSTNLLLQNCSSKFDLIHNLSLLKIRKYVFLSSGGTIYNDSFVPHTEDESPNPESIYALEKMILENYIKIYNNENSDLDYLILRLSNPYGGVTSRHKKQGIIDVLISKMEKDEELEFFGNVKNIRDYIYIDNLVEYIYKISISKCKNDIFNIGTGIGNSVEDVFDIVQNIYKKKIKIKLCKTNTANINCNILDVEKIKRHIKLTPIYSLEEGIKTIIQQKTNI